MKIKFGKTELETPFTYEANGFFYDATGYAFANVRQAGDYHAIGAFIVSALNNREGWNKVSDGLPTEYGSYLVQCDNGKMRVCGYFGNKENPEPRFYFPYSEHGHDSVIAWRNLPSAYEETK
jgi:hypothetical protein